MNVSGRWSATLAMPVQRERDHIRGADPASHPNVVTLVEYGDYECPYCRAAHPVVAQLESQLRDQVCFVYRHFPLASIHPNAQPAAEAAEAAASQGRFWPMHDRLYTSAPLTHNMFVASASALGVDAGKFAVEMLKHVHLPRIEEDFSSGIQSGVNGTPAFYINDRRHNGKWDFPTLYAALTRAAQIYA